VRRFPSVLLLAATLLLSAAAGGGEKPLSPADERYQLAGALYARGEFARAAEEYSGFARRFARDPRAPEASFRSAESLYRAGKNKKARAAFQKCLKLKLPAARAAAARLRIGTIQYAAGDATGAAATLAGLQMKHLSTEARQIACYFLGAALLENGKKKAANVYLRTAAASKRAEIAAPALLELARAESESGRRAGAAKHLDALLKNFPNSPQAPEAGFRKAEALRAAGKAAAALPLYAAVLKRSPPGELAARAALGAAWGYLGKGDATGALKMADLAGHLAALKIESLYARGLALTAAKKFAEAEKAFALIVKLEPKGTRAEDAACRIVWCRLRAGKNSQVGLAAREFRARFAGSKLHSEVAHVEGLAAAATGDTGGALSALDRAMSDPKGRFAAESAFRAAQICSQQGKPREARARLARLVKNHPKHVLADPALVRLGELALAAGDLKAATGYFDRQLSSFPKSKRRPAALLGRALCSAGAKNWKDFQSRCRQIAASHPNDPRGAEASYWLAWNHERVSSYDLAIRQYNALITRYKRPPLVYEFKYRLCCAYYLNANFPKAAEGFLGLARSGKRKLPAEALLWLGRYLGVQGRSKEAAEVYAKAAAAKDPAARAEARLALGQQALEAGKAAEAVKLYQQLLADAPGFSRADDARLGLARALRRANRPKEATKIAARLATSKSERTRLAARGEMALAELALGKAAAARKGLEPLAVLYDDSSLVPAWLQGLARAEEKLANKPAANKWYRELMTRYPRSTEAAAASKKTGIPLPKAPPKPGTKF
jgi:TolA-binding protein